MEQQEALEMLRASRQQVIDAEQAFVAAQIALIRVKEYIAVALGPHKIGDRVQREGEAHVYEITRADLMVFPDEVYPEFYGRRVKPDGTLAVKGERYVSTMNDEKWQRVSLPLE